MGYLEVDRECRGDSRFVRDKIEIIHRMEWRIDEAGVDHGPRSRVEESLPIISVKEPGVDLLVDENVQNLRLVVGLKPFHGEKHLA